ncbi:c-type cytochrome [Poseidonocella sedimentorum]|uniref:Cytochrome c n=1 Tax=Poseidonocella sedimentorum TaxID=871652 RepID=A0A1I6CV87_9RHOB|nr:c-type cytochrome [Poseidonocella sedimentorum]SFQ97023.1 Cytochrome c [Poseidonocella sedimentorum]
MSPLPALARTAALALALPAMAQAQSSDVLLNCSACHSVGPEPGGAGARARLYPDLNGQPARYLERQLHAFRDGRRQHRQMHLTAVELGEGAGAMARLYADAPRPELAPEPGAEPVPLVNEGDWSRGVPSCASCHALEQGTDRARATPRLHGLPRGYLEAQLRAYAEGTRRSDPMGRMRAFAQRLDPGEIAALSAYYASWAPAGGDMIEGSDE